MAVSYAPVRQMIPYETWRKSVCLHKQGLERDTQGKRAFSAWTQLCIPVNVWNLSSDLKMRMQDIHHDAKLCACLDLDRRHNNSMSKIMIVPAWAAKIARTEVWKAAWPPCMKYLIWLPVPTNAYSPQRTENKLLVHYGCLTSKESSASALASLSSCTIITGRAGLQAVFKWIQGSRWEKIGFWYAGI